MLILRPCNSCIVKPLCTNACEKIRRRARLFHKFKIFASVIGILSYLVAFLIIVAHPERPNHIPAIIIMCLLVNSVAVYIIVEYYIKRQIKVANYKFNENLLTGNSLFIFNVRPMKPPPPPKPPPKRYVNH